MSTENKSIIDQKIRNTQALGSNIRLLRKDQKITQEQMVARLQLYGFRISRSIYSQMECGTYNIKANQLVAIANILNTDINTLFRGIEGAP